MMKTIALLIILAVAMSMCRNRTMHTDRDNVKSNQSAYQQNKDEDNDFLMEASQGGLMEVEMGRYAQQNAFNTRVRNFGAMMVKDHSAANDQLKDIAQKKNVNPPATLGDKYRDKVADIQKQTGADFDREYMKEMVDDHEKDVDHFKRYAEKGNDPQLKNFASKLLPTLLMHLDSAKQIHNAIK